MTPRYERLKRLRSYCIERDPQRLTQNPDPGITNDRARLQLPITDIHAPGLSAPQAAALVERRRELVQHYQRQLADARRRFADGGPADVRRYHLLGPNRGRERARGMVSPAESRHPHAGALSVPMQPWYRDRFGWQAGDFPRAEAYYDVCLSLPLFPTMADRDVTRVVTALRAAVARSD